MDVQATSAILIVDEEFHRMYMERRNKLVLFIILVCIAAILASISQEFRIKAINLSGMSITPGQLIWATPTILTLVILKLVFTFTRIIHYRLRTIQLRYFLKTRTKVPRLQNYLSSHIAIMHTLAIYGGLLVLISVTYLLTFRYFYNALQEQKGLIIVVYTIYLLCAVITAIILGKLFISLVKLKFFSHKLLKKYGQSIENRTTISFPDFDHDWENRDENLFSIIIDKFNKRLPANRRGRPREDMSKRDCTITITDGNGMEVQAPFTVCNVSDSGVKLTTELSADKFVKLQRPLRANITVDGALYTAGETRLARIRSLGNKLILGMRILPAPGSS